MSRKKSKTKLKKTATWQGIEQSSRSRGVSDQAKQRRLSFWIKWGGLALAFIGLIALGGYGIYSLKTKSYLGGFARSVEDIEFETDGVLTKTWFCMAMPLVDKNGLMKVDIFSIKEALEAKGQICSAIVERQFPDTLKVTLEEHKPILKVVAVNDMGKHEGYLISDQGHIYKGWGYSRNFLKGLLFVDGIELTPEGDGFKPLAHMESVVDMLQTVRAHKPALYAHWRSISLKYLKVGVKGLDAYFKIKTRGGRELLFTPNDFLVQLNRLETILRYMNDDDIASIKQIDLSVDGQAAVSIARYKQPQKVKNKVLF